jgi:putative transposase
MNDRETATVSGLFSREQIAAKLLSWEDHEVWMKRTGLVPRAEDWRSGSFNRWLHKPERDPRRLTPWPITRPPRWAERVNQPLSAPELQQVRTSVNWGTPFGDETWVHRIAQKLNLHSTLRPPGRPHLSRLLNTTVSHESG